MILTRCLILYMFLDRMLCMFLRSEARNFFLGLVVEIVGVGEFFFSSLKDKWWTDMDIKQSNKMDNDRTKVRTKVTY